MCGRFTRHYTWKQVHDFLDLQDPAPLFQALRASFNVAPTQDSAIVRLDESGKREGVIARWGLIPFWAKDTKIGNSLINARGDTVATKPAYRAAYKKRRCLVPISGFYEWQKVPGAKVKQPWYFRPAKGDILCLAGLWERWDQGDGPLDTFSIITTDANAIVGPCHDRMPVILKPGDFDRWLQAESDPAELQALLVPAAKSVLTAHPVSTRVNTPRNNEPALIERIATPTPESSTRRLV